MKILKGILHPYSIVLLFCMILINGQAIGGPYIFYLLMGLPYGAFHSIIGILGIVLLIITANLSQNNILSVCLLNVLGALCMITSLIYFFVSDKTNYNIETFRFILPAMILVLFGLLIAAFIVRNIVAIALPTLKR